MRVARADLVHTSCSATISSSSELSFRPIACIRSCTRSAIEAGSAHTLSVATRIFTQGEVQDACRPSFEVYKANIAARLRGEMHETYLLMRPHGVTLKCDKWYLMILPWESAR